jgi:hypothetical protein
MLRRLDESLICAREREFVAWMARSRAPCTHLFARETCRLELVAEPLHVVVQAAGFVAQRDEVCGEPVGRIVVGCVEAAVEERELGAQAVNVPVQLLRGRLVASREVGGVIRQVKTPPCRADGGGFTVQAPKLGRNDATPARNTSERRDCCAWVHGLWLGCAEASNAVCMFSTQSMERCVARK